MPPMNVARVGLSRSSLESEDRVLQLLDRTPVAYTGPIQMGNVGLQEFGGTGGASGFYAAETTLQFNQLVELGQKRQRPTHIAELNQDLAAWDYESARIAVLAQIAETFIRTLAIQDRITLAKTNLKLAQETFGAFHQRVQAGATSPLDQSKAGVVVDRAKIDLKRVEQELAAARLGLAATWGRSMRLTADRRSARFHSLDKHR